MDIIDLGKDFFLVRFGLKEDFLVVLEKGPWFIGGALPIYKAMGAQL